MSTPKQPAPAREDLFDRARDGLEALSESLESGRGEAVAESALQSLSEIEAASHALAMRLRSRPVDGLERNRLIGELRDLRRRAYVCAALAESQALFLQWGQESAFSAREYTPSGRIASESARSAKEWEA